MTKIALELDDIKALASDSRLEILKALDGKNLSLKDITKITSLNKATLHVHLSKLLEAGFIKKKEREGHKWVYYKLTWKGESLLHPENTKIVVLFSISIISFFVGILQLITYAKGTIVGFAETLPESDMTQIYALPNRLTPTNTTEFFNQQFQNVGQIPIYNQTLGKLSQTLNQNSTINGLAGNSFPDEAIQWSVATNPTNLIATIQDPFILYLSLTCFAIFSAFLSIVIRMLWKNRKPMI